MLRRKQETSLFRLTFKDFATFVGFIAFFALQRPGGCVFHFTVLDYGQRASGKKKAFPFVNSIKGYVFRTMVFIYALILAVY